MVRPSSSDYWGSQVWKRRRKLVRDRALWLSLLLASLSTTLAPNLPLGRMDVSELADLGLLYAALSFGAAIAGAGITFGVPGTDRLKRWSRLQSPASDFPVLSNLAFVFAWAALTQIGVVITCFLAIAIGGSASVIPLGRNFAEAPTHYTLVGLGLWLWWYALFELTAVVRTIMQVIDAVVTEEQNTAIASISAPAQVPQALRAPTSGWRRLLRRDRDVRGPTQ